MQQFLIINAILNFFLGNGIETVIWQLTERFNIEKVRARKIWRLTNRVARKILSHTASVLINKEIGNPPLQLELLLAKP